MVAEAHIGGRSASTPDPPGPIILEADPDDALLLHHDLVRAGALPKDSPLDLIEPCQVPKGDQPVAGRWQARSGALRGVGLGVRRVKRAGKAGSE